MPRSWVKPVPPPSKMSIPNGLLQRKCACGGSPGAGGVCEECQKKRLDLQRKETGGGGPAIAPPIVYEVLSSPGRPLDREVRSTMEPRFGHDFSRVRVHTDAQAAASAEAVGALAYAVGNHLVFGAGQFRPETIKGRSVLAHELAHSAQQGFAEPAPSTEFVVGPENDPAEGEANRIAESVTSAGPIPQIGTGHRALVRRLGARNLVCTTLRGACPENSDLLRDAREAVRRMEATGAGQWLIGALSSNRRLRNSTINMRFSSAVVRREGGVMGSFDPDEIGASSYNAWVDVGAHQSLRTATPQPPSSPLPQPVSTYGGGEVVIPSYVVERTSLLAETLFHELLHIWYLNTFGDLGLGHPNAPRWGTSPFTGHRVASLGEIERPFAQRLRQFAVDIYRVETTPRPASVQPPASAEQPPSPSPSAREEPQAPRRAEEETREGRFSLYASLGASGAWVPPVTGAQVGLDARVGFLYGRSIRFSAAGSALYVPNQGLFAVGGEAGVRFLQSEESLTGGTQRVRSPLFFDLQAGAAYVLRPNDPLLLTVGIGVGQEIGPPGGWAAFWRVGGALQASPTTAMQQVGGSVGVTLGVRTPGL